MQQSDLFAYLAAFVTIVLALALSDLLLSLHRLLRRRAEVQWDPLPLIVALWAYLTILSEFFTLWSELSVQRFTYLELVGEMVVPALISLVAFSVLPDEVPADGLNLTTFYHSQRRYWVVLLGLLMAADVTRNFIWLFNHGYIGDPRAWLWYGIGSAVFAGILAVMWCANSRKMQTSAVIALNLHGLAGYYGWAVQSGG